MRPVGKNKKSNIDVGVGRLKGALFIMVCCKNTHLYGNVLTILLLIMELFQHSEKFGPEWIIHLFKICCTFSKTLEL